MLLNYDVITDRTVYYCMGAHALALVWWCRKGIDEEIPPVSLIPNALHKHT